MVNPASCRFNNYRSVRFNLDSFDLPVAVSKKKNTIYTNQLEGLKGTSQLTLLEPKETYGFNHAVIWGPFIFASNDEGLFYANKFKKEFTVLEQTVFPPAIEVVDNRLYLLSAFRDRITYSTDLMGEWDSSNFLEGGLYLPASHGSCLDIRYYHGKLLVICERGLFAMNRSFALEHLADDSELLKASLVDTGARRWGSDWFSLGYATNTQTLREVFLKTNVNLILTVMSNRTQRNIQVKAANKVQKIRVNLNGDQFKLALWLPEGNSENVVVSDLSAVVAYGKRG